MQARWALPVAMVVSAALYWLGLSGPFIFDDPWNLEPVRLWLDGQASLMEVLFPSESIVFSRPVAMGSFALTTWLFGDTTFSFKLGNLIIHMACGWLGWVVLRQALSRDSRLAPHANLLAAVASAFWLLHPLHVSTVLYAVQRMAQLSTFFALAAVWAYLSARKDLMASHVKPASVKLFAVFPIFVLLGVLSKQNAAVAPALCLVFELAFFSGEARSRRAMYAFFAVFLLLPLAAGIGLLAVTPEKLLGGYSEWDFTLWQRLLTQGRALMDYIGMLLIPRGPLMGLYTDDFAVSTGLLSPISTLLSLLALAAISVTAVVLRKRAPSFFAGWFFFLVAHGVESTFLPLEMYYEHRNYLPSLGLFLALMGLIALVPGTVRTNVLSLKQLGSIAAVGFALVLCMATFGRVLIWQDMSSILRQGLKTHPESLRANFDMAAWSLGHGDYETALAHMHRLTRSDNPRYRQLGNLSVVAINCMRGTDQDNVRYLQAAAAENLPRLTTFEAQSFIRLSGSTKEKGCGSLDRAMLAQYLKQILDAAPTQAETAAPKWFSRYAVADILARSGQWQEAQQQAQLAWDGGHDKKVGVFLASAYIQNGDLNAADALLAELREKIQPYDMQGQTALSNLERGLAAKRGGKSD